MENTRLQGRHFFNAMHPIKKFNKTRRKRKLFYSWGQSRSDLTWDFRIQVQPKSALLTMAHSSSAMA